ncbi:MAG: oligosaccharide flippase family protein [Nanoarchaeota archaeon]|nr:oligosaccharide flippase family protein [Nanoarchaeota archaeon]
MKGIYHKIGLRLSWKILELITIILLVILLPRDQFGAGFFALCATSFLKAIFSFTYIGDQDDREVYAALSMLAPVAGALFSGLIYFLSFFVGESMVAFKFASAIILFAGFALTPEIYFKSREEYEKVYFTYTISQLAALVVSLGLVLAGQGFVSVLYGGIAFYIFNTFQLWKLFPYRPSSVVTKEAVAKLLSSVKVSMPSELLKAFIKYGPMLFAGIYLGMDDFSHLFFGITLGYFIFDNISSYSLGFFKGMLEDKETRAYAFTRIFEYVSFIAAPLCFVGVAVFRPLLGYMSIGESDIVFILLIAGAIRAILHPAKLVVKDRVQARLMVLELIMLALLSLAFWSMHGFGLALAILIAGTASSILLVLVADRKIHFISGAKEAFISIFSGIFSGLYAGLLTEILGTDISTLVLVYLLGLGAYVLLTFVLNNDLYKRFVKFIFHLREQR